MGACCVVFWQVLNLVGRLKQCQENGGGGGLANQVMSGSAFMEQAANSDMSRGQVLRGAAAAYKLG